MYSLSEEKLFGNFSNVIFSVVCGLTFIAMFSALETSFPSFKIFQVIVLFEIVLKKFLFSISTLPTPKYLN